MQGGIRKILCSPIGEGRALRAVKSCFANIVEVSGFLIPEGKAAVRPERPGIRVFLSPEAKTWMAGTKPGHDGKE